MHSAAPPPTVPTGRYTSSRRQSNPTGTTSLAPRTPKRNRPVTAFNNANLQPASPEVISSLISSLSTISAPLSDHFENSPLGASRSIDDSSGVFSTHFPDFSGGHVREIGTPPSTGGGFGMDYGAYRNSSLNDSVEFFDVEDDAAIPPVVRTSKPRNRPPPIISAPSSRGRSRPGSRNSVAERDDLGSLTNLSIDPGTKSITSETGSGFLTTDDPKVTKRRSHRSLLYMSSKEQLREKEVEKRRSFTTLPPSTGDNSGLARLEESASIITKKPSETFLAEIPINEEPLFEADDPDIGPSTRHTLFENSLLGSPSTPGGIGSQFIPMRDSSLRHSTPTKKKKSRRSSRTSRTSRQSYSTNGKEKERELDDDKLTLSSGDILLEMEEHFGRNEKVMLKEKHSLYTPLEIITDPPMRRISSPLGSPKFPMPPRGPPQVSASPDKTGQSWIYDEDDDEQDCAPSPAILQRRSREGADILGSLGVKTSKGAPRPPRPKTSYDLLPPSTPTRPTKPAHHSQPASPARTYDQQPFYSPQSSPPKRRVTMPAEDRPTSSDSIDDAVDAYLLSPRLTQKIRHPQTGRVISFSEVGDSEGYAVFCCVGMGLTRYITAFYDELALTLKLRLITPDRPGVGESGPYADGTSTPLGWPDDVQAICQALKISKYSILAHSAGAIYALATALRMPQNIRGKIHLLAPWIPPSQMSPIGSTQVSPPSGGIPASQRFLRALPTTFYRAANSSFMSATSSSITSSLPKSPRRPREKDRTSKRRSGVGSRDVNSMAADRTTGTSDGKRDSLMFPGINDENMPPTTQTSSNELHSNSEAAILAQAATTLAGKERQMTYDRRLTHAIWDLATTNANPALDLIVCLERRQAIGFRYVDITKPVVIHHGTRDTRVPVENVKWLGKTMKKCEVRILDGEGHGLMASPTVMGNVLVEISKEWEDLTNAGRYGGSGSRAGGGHSMARRVTPVSR